MRGEQTKASSEWGGGGTGGGPAACIPKPMQQCDRLLWRVDKCCSPDAAERVGLGRVDPDNDCRRVLCRAPCRQPHGAAVSRPCSQPASRAASQPASQPARKLSFGGVGRPVREQQGRNTAERLGRRTLAGHRLLGQGRGRPCQVGERRRRRRWRWRRDEEGVLGRTAVEPVPCVGLGDGIHAADAQRACVQHPVEMNATRAMAVGSSGGVTKKGTTISSRATAWKGCVATHTCRSRGRLGSQH